MLCSVIRVAVPVCIGIIVIDITHQFSNFFSVQGALPPGAKDEIVLIEHLPGRKVHLEDFFWSGAEDAPPWLDPDQTLNFYETRTIHRTSTVYVTDRGISTEEGGKKMEKDPRAGPRDPGCISCIDPTPTLVQVDQDIGVLIGEDPGPRYWLLTVLRSGESVPAKVELRLARLYRAAFSRQQQRHLGLLATDPRLRRAAKHRLSLEDHPSIFDPIYFYNNETAEEKNDAEMRKPEVRSESSKEEKETKKNITKPVEMRQLKIRRNISENIEISKNSEESKKNYSNNFSMNKSTIEETKNGNEHFLKKESSRSSIADSNLIGPRGRRYEISNSSNKTKELSREELKKENGRNPRELKMETMFLEHSPNNRSDFLNSSRSKLRSVDVGTVQVRMQNTSITETGSTRLIYSVHLGGKPVPAETAAKDMALLSPQEVALELGVPVIIQSEPYLKESRPLALSRKRDAWLLIGAAGAAMILLTLVIAVLVIGAKRKRARSAVSAPPIESILKKDRGYTPTTPGLDNTGYTSETEGRTQTDGTSLRQTPGSHSRSPITPLTPESLEDDIQELSSDDDEILKRQQSAKSWDIEEYPGSVKRSRENGRGRVTRRNAIDKPTSPVSMESLTNEEENTESLEEGRNLKLEGTASPHSYLSMPSCKLFPSMRSVEPLSKILEPVAVRHLDLEFESPEIGRRGTRAYENNGSKDEGLSRTTSALKDPGVVGPIVWDLRRQRAVEENRMRQVEGLERVSVSGPVGRARTRLHELLEDSFNLFGTKDVRSKEPACFSSGRNSATKSSHHPLGSTFSESRGKSAHVSPVGTPITQTKMRPRTSLPRGEDHEEKIPETGNIARHPRGAWGSRPLSAGPFHRPNLPEIDVNRILADHQLPPEDPAVPLIAAIRKELDKFSPEMRSQ